MIALKLREDNLAEAFVNIDIAEICKHEFQKEDQENLFLTIENVCKAAQEFNATDISKNPITIIDASGIDESIPAEMEFSVWCPFIKKCISELSKKTDLCLVFGMKKKFIPLLKICMAFLSPEIKKKIIIEENLVPFSKLDNYRKNI